MIKKIGNWLIVLILAAAAIYYLPFQLIWLYNFTLLSLNGRQTEGVVTQVLYSNSYGVRASFEVNGVTYTSIGDRDKGVLLYEEGDRLPVQYLPDNPKISYAASHGDVVTKAIFTDIITLFVIVVGVIGLVAKLRFPSDGADSKSMS